MLLRNLIAVSVAHLRAREGEPVRFRVPGQPDDFVGVIYATEPNVQASRRAFTARARVRTPGGVLTPGTLAEVSLVLDEIPEALLIPTASVITGADSTTVFVLRDGTAVPRTVTTGVRTADRIQITSGLTADDVVLTSGLSQVRPGQAVRPGGAFGPTRVAPGDTPERAQRRHARQRGLPADAGRQRGPRRLAERWLRES